MWIIQEPNTFPGKLWAPQACNGTAFTANSWLTGINELWFNSINSQLDAIQLAVYIIVSMTHGHTNIELECLYRTVQRTECWNTIRINLIADIESDHEPLQGWVTKGLTADWLSVEKIFWLFGLTFWRQNYFFKF